MGQYYKPYIRDEEGTVRVFCSQNAVFMTVHGICKEEDMPSREELWAMNNDDPNAYYNLFSGLKLMEHSWIDNDFVNGVVEFLSDNPCAVAWVGDYANEAGDFKGAYTTGVYSAAWGDDSLPEGPFDKMPATHREGFVVNRSKGVYIDLAEYAEFAAFTPSWDRSGGEWCIHPLPLLTCIGNGRGGGDYHGTCMDMVGRWAMDIIEFAEERPEGMREIDYSRIAFREE